MDGNVVQYEKALDVVAGDDLLQIQKPVPINQVAAAELEQIIRKIEAVKVTASDKHCTVPGESIITQVLTAYFYVHRSAPTLPTLIQDTTLHLHFGFNLRNYLHYFYTHVIP